jgi:hypothetical protein
MGMPTNGTSEEITVRGLSNSALANQVGTVAHRRRAFPKRYTDVLLAEAKRRLRWADAYGAHQ